MNLLSSINKALKLEADPLYFIFILIVRCSISAVFKSFVLGVCIKRKCFKLKRAKINLVFNAIPSISVYIAVMIARSLLNLDESQYMEVHITIVFTMFMVISRCIRSFWKVLNLRRKSDKKKLKLAKKTMKLKKKKMAFTLKSDSTVTDDLASNVSTTDETATSTDLGPLEAYRSPGKESCDFREDLRCHSLSSVFQDID